MNYLQYLWKLIRLWFIQREIAFLERQLANVRGDLQEWQRNASELELEIWKERQYRRVGAA